MNKDFKRVARSVPATEEKIIASVYQKQHPGHIIYYYHYFELDNENQLTKFTDVYISYTDAKELWEKMERMRRFKSLLMP